MTLTIDGIDMTPYVAAGGYKWTRNDLDSEQAGRFLNGLANRNRVAQKRTLEISCRPLTDTEAALVLQTINPEWVTVSYSDPMTGGTLTGTMYSNNVPASHLFTDRDGVNYWHGIVFPLIEQ